MVMHDMYNPRSPTVFLYFVLSLSSSVQAGSIATEMVNWIHKSYTHLIVLVNGCPATHLFSPEHAFFFFFFFVIRIG